LAVKYVRGERMCGFQ
jgi:hypothetical protein